MGLRESVRNFFYAVTHADQLVNEHKAAISEAEALAAQNARFLEQSVAGTKELCDRQQAMQSVMRVLLPENPALSQLKELYSAVEKDLDHRGAKAYHHMEAVQRFGFLDRSDRGREELEKIIYTNTLVSLGVLPKDREIYQLGEEARHFLCQELGALELPKDMPVGKIDYLAPSGKIAETMEFCNAAEFVEQAKHDNYHCGNHMAITVYSDPGTGKHIDTSWKSTLDPMPSFNIAIYGEEKQPLKDKISNAQMKQPQIAAHGPAVKQPSR